MTWIVLTTTTLLAGAWIMMALYASHVVREWLETRRPFCRLLTDKEMQLVRTHTPSMYRSITRTLGEVNIGGVWYRPVARVPNRLAYHAAPTGWRALFARWCIVAGAWIAHSLEWTAWAFGGQVRQA